MVYKPCTLTHANLLLRRRWTNPELVIFDAGLRLEKLEQQKIDLIMALLKASLG